jgi:hypothetical protein
MTTMDQLPYEIVEIIIKHTGFFRCVELGWNDMAEKLYDEKIHGWEVMIIQGNLDIIKWLYKSGKEYNLHSAMYEATECGHIEIIKYLNALGMDHDYDAMNNIIANGNVEVLKRLLEVGMVYDGYCECYDCEECERCIEYKYAIHEDKKERDSYEMIIPHDIDNTAYHGHTDLFKYLHEIGMECKEFTMYNAAKRGHLEIIKFICEVINPIDGKGSDDLNIAAKYGQKEVIKLLFTYGKYSISNAVVVAAKYGHLDVVRYLYKLFRQTTGVIIDIANNHHYVDIIDYIYKKIKDTNAIIVKLATDHDHDEIVEYMIENDVSSLTCSNN